MKVKIVNVLGDYKITTETGAFYPGTYPTYGDAAKKCEMNGFEIIDGDADILPSEAVRNQERLTTPEIGAAALVRRIATMPDTKISLQRICLDTFTEEQRRRCLKTGECAEILGVSDQHILNLIDEGTLGALDLSIGKLEKPKRVLRIPPNVLFDFIISRLSLSPECLGLFRAPREALERMRDRIDEYLNIKTAK